MTKTRGSGYPYFMQAQLEDFLSEEGFIEAMFAIRWRIIRVFAKGRSAPGRYATPGYVVGLNSQLSSLATYVGRRIGPHGLGKVFSADDVSGRYRNWPKKDREAVARHVQTELIMRQLVLMKDGMHDLWYVNGEWWMRQGAQDEFLLLMGGAKASFRNQRAFHGRPTRDRSRLRGLRMAPGVSTAAS